MISGTYLLPSWSMYIIIYTCKVHFAEFPRQQLKNQPSLIMFFVCVTTNVRPVPANA